jgi:hypothetical protein
METFDKYKFIDDLENFLKSEIENGNDTDIHDLIREYINNEIVYYSYCWDICKECNAHNFTVCDAKCTDITELAYFCLLELVYTNVFFTGIQELYNKKFNQ